MTIKTLVFAQFNNRPRYVSDDGKNYVLYNVGNENQDVHVYAIASARHRDTSPATYCHYAEREQYDVDGANK